MKPLLVLIITFLIAAVIFKLVQDEIDLLLSARIALSVMLVFTAVAHFSYTKGMTMMLPGFIPYKKELVYFTGLIELLAAIGLLIPKLQVLTGCMLILFFVLLLPANIYAAMRHVDYQKGTYEGSGANYLWFRVPLQILFVIWTYICTLR